MHGKVTAVRHNGERLFKDCPQPMQTARYHSLIVDRASLPGDLIVDAETEDGVVMALSHRERPVFGIQFHPESFGTLGGDAIILNFLRVIPSREDGEESPTGRRSLAPLGMTPEVR